MSKPTPEQMLKLAKIVYPNRKWSIVTEDDMDFVVVPAYRSVWDCERFSPKNDSKNLLDTLFAMWEKKSPKIIGNRLESMLKPYPTMGGNKVPSYEQAIINLAIEILC